MEKFSKRFEAWVIALKHRIAIDIFASARFKITFLYFIMGVIILGVSGYLVYAHIISIIQDVLQAVQRLLAEPANLDQATITQTLIQTISVEINKMNISLGFWVLITIVVTAYVLAGITLRPIKEAMEKQRRFIANVSHELRTPLSVMKTNSEITLRNASKLSPPDFMEALRGNLEEVDRMAAITQFLLDFSGVENRLTHLKLVDVDLSLIATKSVKVMQMVATAKGVSLSYVDGNPVMIKGNAIALEEMLLNLLKNAINYTPSGKSVRVTLSGKSYGGYALAIHDMGVGIAEKDLPKIFEPFYRASNRISRDHVGLGMAIVREIANLHRARVSIKSTVGHGTTVIIKFPIS